VLTLVIVVGAVLLAAFMFWVIRSKKKAALENTPRYVCSRCGEKHCDCNEQPES